MYNLSSAQGQRFAEIAREMTEKVRELGPNPARNGRTAERRKEGEKTDDSSKQKTFEEIVELIKPYKFVLLLGCNECVTVCATGGAKEVEVLASELRMHRAKDGQPIEIKEHVLERNCDPEYVESLGRRHGRRGSSPFHGLRLRHSVRGRALPIEDSLARGQYNL